MKKEVMKWGTSLVISFDLKDQKIYGIKEGSILDLSDMTVDNKKACSKPLSPKLKGKTKRGKKK